MVEGFWKFVMEAPLQRIVGVAGVALIALAVIGRLKRRDSLKPRDRAVVGVAGIALLSLGMLWPGPNRETTKELGAIEFVTDASWQTSADAPEKWYSNSSKAGSWSPAHVLALSHLLDGVDSSPRIWSAAGGDTCYLRGVWPLTRQELETRHTAQLKAHVDDDCRVYINGKLLALATMGRAHTFQMDIRGYLEPRDNVIAIEAWSVGGSRGVALKVTLK